MPVRGIFLKIYLCFWLATLLVIAAQIGVDWLSSTGPFGGGPPGREHLRRTLSPVLILYGHSVIDRSKSGDREAIARSAKRLKDMSGISAYLIDSAGAVIGGGEVPQNVGDIVGKARQTGKAEFSSSKTREVIALPMRGEDGKDYHVVGDIPRMLFGPPPPAPRHMNGGRAAPPPLVFGPAFLFPPGPRPFSLLRLFVTLFISGAVCYLLARYLTSPIIRLREAACRFANGDVAARIGGKKARWKDELSELVRRQGSSVAASTLDRIEKETGALNEMIGQVLELTRVESNMETIEMAPVDLVILLNEIVDDANFEASARSRAVRFCGGETCAVSGNEEWLRRGIENVIRNAIRYTRDNTTIEVNLDKTVEAGTEYARISIRDHGGGVPEKDLPHLFRPFYRVSNARERQTGGSGLGLAITERAVFLHHGSVTAQNHANGGLIVIIKLRA